MRINFRNPLTWIILFAIFIAIIAGITFFGPSNKPRPGSCLILQEKYCKQVQFIDDPNTPGELLAAYNIPKGAPIFTPADGRFSKTTFLFKDSTGKFITYPGISVTVGEDQTTHIFDIRYSFIYFTERDHLVRDVIKKGDIIGIVSNSSTDYLGNYNLAVRITKSNPEGKVQKNSKLLRMTLEPKIK